MATVDAPARPDLSALPRDVRLRIEVAEAEGAAWQAGSEAGSWWLVIPSKGGAYQDDLLFIGKRGSLALPYPLILFGLPKYTSDPAAWGALMERELARWETDDGGEHWCAWRDNDGWVHRGPWATTIGVSACLAVLAKHGRDTTWYTEGETR
jgi:hypothetical protein